MGTCTMLVLSQAMNLIKILVLGFFPLELSYSLDGISPSQPPFPLSIPCAGHISCPAVGEEAVAEHLTPGMLHLHDL